MPQKRVDGLQKTNKTNKQKIRRNKKKRILLASFQDPQMSFLGSPPGVAATLVWRELGTQSTTLLVKVRNRETKTEKRLATKWSPEDNVLTSML